MHVIEESLETEKTVVALPCAFANLRRATRVVTKLYQEEFRTGGLEGSSHFTLLQVLSLRGELTQGELAELLAVDSTTLSRTLRLMVDRGWLRIRPGREDRRLRLLALTAAGRRQLDRSRGDWERAQARLRAALGEDFERLNALLRKVASLAPEA